MVLTIGSQSKCIVTFANVSSVKFSLIKIQYSEISFGSLLGHKGIYLRQIDQMRTANDQYLL